MAAEKQCGQEADLDEALAQSFPASDPPAALTPHPPRPGARIVDNRGKSAKRASPIPLAGRIRRPGGDGRWKEC